MPIKVTYTTIKTKEDGPNEFFPEKFWSRPEIVSHIETTYKETEKLLSTDHSLSEDAMTSVWIEYWDSQESCDQYLSDPLFADAIKARIEYRTLHEIQFNADTQEIDINKISVGSYYTVE
jgi:quinol monooxygenase YgiN